MHYLMQIDLATLRDATLPHFDGIEWGDAWEEKGGTKYIGHYSAGQANISGPYPVGNPNAPWFEVIGSKPAVIDQLAALASESMEMHEGVTSRGPLRAMYKAQGRRVIRNAGGKPVGVMCDFTIGGRDATNSSLGGRDPEEMPELLDMET